jgi:hypothetical protein
MKSIGIVGVQKHIPREHLDRRLAQLFSEVTARKKYGKITISFQGGNFRTIEKQEVENLDTILAESP